LVKPEEKGKEDIRVYTSSSSSTITGEDDRRNWLPELPGVRGGDDIPDPDAGTRFRFVPRAGEGARAAASVSSTAASSPFETDPVSTGLSSNLSLGWRR
jgi:hypothetical protein